MRSAVAIPFLDSRSVPHMYTMRRISSLLFPRIFVYFALAPVAMVLSTVVLLSVVVHSEDVPAPMLFQIYEGIPAYPVLSILVLLVGVFGPGTTDEITPGCGGVTSPPPPNRFARKFFPPPNKTKASTRIIRSPEPPPFMRDSLVIPVLPEFPVPCAPE